MTSKRWISPPEQPVPEALLAAVGDDLLARLLVARGITHPQTARAFLDPDAYRPASPFELPDMNLAAERIEQAIHDGEKLLVWGDFDVDGQTSTALLVSALRALGAQVEYYVPHRQHEGHGVHIPSLMRFLDEGIQLIITCDTGISAHDAVDYAHGRGVDVIITDHHQLPAELPRAYAAINPQRLTEGHPLRTLPGVGAAYKLVQALYERAGRLDFDGEVGHLLDLVALGIVADVAEQRGDTRYLLQRGLAELRRTERLSLRLLMEQAGVNQVEANEESIGFVIGPRLNAVGRLDDANASVELLLTDEAHRGRAQMLVNRLEGLNADRRMYVDDVMQAAQTQIEDNPSLLDDAALVLFGENWIGGVVGLVASRLVETHQRPVVLLTTSPGEPHAHGSARSVEGVDITAAIAAQADLLEGYGGHRMAAGLRLSSENIEKFRRGFVRTVAAMRGDRDTSPTLEVHHTLMLKELDLTLVERLERLAPFGAGNPPVVLVTEKLTLQAQRTIGRTGDHLKLTVCDEHGTTRDVVWWQAEPEKLPSGRFDLAYGVRANTYQGQREVQLVLIDLRPVDEEPQTYDQRAGVEILDFRADAEADQRRLVEGLTEAVIWNEGAAQPGIEMLRRDALERGDTLVIWTAPPGRDVLQAALDAVNPGTVYLVGVDPGMDSVNGFLQRLAGLVKHALNQREGRAALQKLAGATAQRESTVRAGLDWMAARGHVRLVDEVDGVLHLAAGDGRAVDDPAQTTTTLATRLKETAAYRAHFRRADPASLLRR